MNAATAVPTASIGRAPDATALRYALWAWGSLFAMTLMPTVMRANRISRLIGIDRRLADAQVADAAWAARAVRDRPMVRLDPAAPGGR